MSPTLLETLLDLGRAVRDRVRQGFQARPDHWSRPAAQAESDLQYALDLLGEEPLLEEVRCRLGGGGPLRLLSEGLAPEGVVVTPGEGGILLIVDPVDGTRGLMHDKRSAFFLAALGPDEPGTRLRQLTHAVMVEIPTSRSHLSDLLAASRPDGVQCQVENLETGARAPFQPTPSQATDLRHGFATVVRFFGGAATALGAVQDELMARLHPDEVEASQDIFEDQYISNGGQLHALITGRDRFVADLRPLFRTAAGQRLRSSHPYDLCAALVAEMAGVILTTPDGHPLDAPLDLVTDVGWVGYASEALRRVVEPHLQALLRARQLLS